MSFLKRASAVSHENGRLTAMLEAHRDQNAAMKTELVELRGRYEHARRAYVDLRDKYNCDTGEILCTIEALRGEVSTLRREAESLREERDKALEEAAALREELDESRAMVQGLLDDPSADSDGPVSLLPPEGWDGSAAADPPSEASRSISGVSVSPGQAPLGPPAAWPPIVD